MVIWKTCLVRLNNSRFYRRKTDKGDRVVTSQKRILAIVLAGLAAACTPADDTLPGERMDIRTDLASDASDIAQDADRSVPFAAPKTVANADWTHRNGDADHAIAHPAYAGALTPIWSAKIGAGSSRRARITADPVVSSGRIFAVDAGATISAHSTSGALLWSRDLTPVSDGANDASGAGLAVDGDTVYVTTGFGELVALDVASGAERWVQDLDAFGGSAPTVFDGLVYVSARDARGWAIEADTGRIAWQTSAAPTSSGVSGGAGPAVNDRVAIFPFASGELQAVFRKGGIPMWSAIVSGGRKGRAGARLSDVTGDPVIVGSTVYAGNQSGRVVALDADSGDRIWTATEGAASPVWPAAGSVFLVSDLNELVRLDASDGSRIWGTQLSTFIKSNERRQKAVYAHYGPVLAGGRLIVASSDGFVRSFDPVSGNQTGSVEIKGGAASNPVVAGGVLYVVSKNGELHAFR